MLLRHSAVGFWLKQRQQRPQGFRGVADEIDLHRIAQRQHVRLDVDLHAARLAFLRQELGIRKARADHEKRVAFRHQLVAGLGAEQTDRAGHPGQIVRQRRLAEQGLGAAGAQLVGDRDDLVGRVERAGADQDRDLLAGIQHVGGAIEIASWGTIFGAA